MKAGGKRRGGSVVGVLVGAIALSAIALGCGKEQTETVSTAKTEEPTTTVAQAKPLPIAANASAMGAPLTQAGTDTTGLVDSLPPDVQVFAPDSLVTPGQVIEITAQGSSDVTELTLKDGLGHEHPFVYDSDAKGWRVAYRVPIGTNSESIALSVRAANDAHRWKRVWVFLKIDGGEAE